MTISKVVELSNEKSMIIEIPKELRGVKIIKITFEEISTDEYLMMKDDELLKQDINEVMEDFKYADLSSYDS